MVQHDNDAPAVKPAALQWHRTLQEAADWYVRLGDAPDDSAQRQAWQHWLHSQAEHQAAWAKITAVGQRFAALAGQTGSTSAAAGLRQAAAPARRRAMRTLAGVMMAGAGGWMVWRYPPAQDKMLAWQADYQTRLGEIRDLHLPDGSHLWLNTASAADFVVKENLRLLTLHQGEVVVQTAHDRAKPFVVKTRFGTMRALGTVFLVRKEAESAHLAVLEGAVQVSLARTGERRIIEQGMQVGIASDRMGVEHMLDQTQAAWRAGVLAVDNMRLVDFLRRLARYRPGYLGVHPDIADLKVMGAYPVPDTDAALALLSEALPIRVQRNLPWWVTIEPR
ncbi:FecR domain-containing protein [Alcaligenes sp. 13f]|uniref:FecR domain-containing protein n=1 Tax=Alcaligenes sp. 13f TaxID=2841924 RepID=UPI001CF61C90|nr:FecR domain-containing protein [Alcaligenes sp. 13f]MCB4320711.1 FecR domain-containing protein [Alcaligenes sp. 13f]